MLPLLLSLALLMIAKVIATNFIVYLLCEGTERERERKKECERILKLKRINKNEH